MLRSLGVDLKIQQELLRPADIQTTLNVYIQAVSEAKREANSQVVLAERTLQDGNGRARRPLLMGASRS